MQDVHGLPGVLREHRCHEREVKTVLRVILLPVLVQDERAHRHDADEAIVGVEHVDIVDGGHVIGHVGWSHYIGNMMYILLLGPMLEEKYGSVNIIELIGVTALITALLSYFLFPGIALCGASGVVFAFILMTSFTSFKEGEIPLTVILVAVIFLGQQIYEGVFLQDNVSNLSHIAGGLVGAFVGYQLNKKK